MTKARAPLHNFPRTWVFTRQHLSETGVFTPILSVRRQGLTPAAHAAAPSLLYYLPSQTKCLLLVLDFCSKKFPTQHATYPMQFIFLIHTSF